MSNSLREIIAAASKMRHEDAKQISADERFFIAVDTFVEAANIHPNAFNHIMVELLCGSIIGSSVKATTLLADRLEQDYPGFQINENDKIGFKGKDKAQNLKLVPDITITKVSDLPIEQAQAHYNDFLSSPGAGESHLIRKITAKIYDTVSRQGLTPFIRVTFEPGNNTSPMPAMNIQQLHHNHLLFHDFRSGRKSLSSISSAPSHVSWHNYDFVLSSPGEYIRHGLSLVCQKIIDTTKDRDTKQRLTALRSEILDTFSNALLTPQQRKENDAASAAAKALEEQQRQEAEAAERAAAAATAAAAAAAAAIAAQIRHDQELLHSLSFTKTGRMLGIEARATRATPAPELDTCDMWQQVKPVVETINVNFTPQKQLGAALFTNEGELGTRILEYIAAGGVANFPNKGNNTLKQPERSEAQREVVRDCMLDFLSKPIEELTPAVQTEGIREPWIAQNRERQQQLIEKISASPLLLIAALGTQYDIQDARQIQGALFPSRPGKKLKPLAETSEYDAKELQQALRHMAGGLLQRSYEETHREVPAAIAAIIERLNKVEIFEKPPAPPPVVPKPIVIPPKPPQPPAPPPAIIVPPVAPEIPFTPTPYDNLRQRADDFLAQHSEEKPPFTMLRCQLGLEPGYNVSLHISRWLNGDTPKRVDTRSCTIKLSEPDLDRALELKQKLQSYIMAKPGMMEHRRLHGGQNGFTSDSVFLPDLAPNPEAEDGKPGKINKRGGVYHLRLRFGENGHSEDVNISLGLKQNASPDEAKLRRDLVLGRVAWARQDTDTLTQLKAAATERHDDASAAVLTQLLENTHEKYRLTQQDVRTWLQHTLTQQGKPWQHAESIDLKDYSDIRREINVDFPAGAAGRTTLLVANPVLEGTPNASWSIPIAISVAGKEIAVTKVNTYVQDSSEALLRINDITDHIKTRLEHYATQHPEAGWLLNHEGNGRLAHSKEHSPDMDWNKLYHIIDELGYARNLSVKVSNIDNVDGKSRFTVSVQRGDGTDFVESQDGSGKALSLKREYIIAAAEATDADRHISAERFRSHAHTHFSKLLADAYGVEQANTDQRKSKQFVSQSVVNMFDDALRDSMKQDFVREAGISEVPEQGKAVRGNAQRRVKAATGTDAHLRY